MFLQLSPAYEEHNPQTSHERLSLVEKARWASPVVELLEVTSTTLVGSRDTRDRQITRNHHITESGHLGTINEEHSLRSNTSLRKVFSKSLYKALYNTHISNISKLNRFKMKLSFSLLVILTASATVAVKVSYDGAKAMRIAVGEDVVPLMSIIEKLELPTWKGVKDGVPVANSHVDLVVPADKVEEFKELTKGMTTEVMHEDLGASIADEGKVSIYARKSELGPTQKGSI